jgi:alpha-N-arabinofuranosidase
MTNNVKGIIMDNYRDDGALLLPDGKAFPLWEDKTSHNKVYFVDQAHPKASDENAGTEDMPFKTINQAARLLKPGEKVIVKSGAYREMISPANGGTSASQMICYEAEPGAKVTIKGSRIMPDKWRRSLDSSGGEYSYKLWQADLPNELFPCDQNPFRTPNASNEDIDLMPWAFRWKDRIPYTLPRGLVFQNGRRMIQLATYEDLVRLPGSYWGDSENMKLHIHPFDSANPNEQCYEVTVQEHLLKPEKAGLGYIKIKGFVFEHAGNGFPRIGVGALYVYGGHHWIIEDNVVRHCNSVGIEAGARTTESSISTEEEKARVKNHEGGFIVRNNTVYDCGTGGIQGHTLLNTLIENNRIYHIGWQDAERYWECAAIKTLVNKQTIVRENIIHDVECASGIWLDWDNRNCRITGNIIYDIRESSNGAVFIEASQVPNMIDNNIIWKAWKHGISLFDTNQTRVLHNLIAYAGTPVIARANTTRKLNGRQLTSRENILKNNIFYCNSSLPVLGDTNNICDNNVYVDKDHVLDTEARENPEWDKNSPTMDFLVNFRFHELELSFETDTSIPKMDRINECSVDFFGKNMNQEKAAPGPIQENFGLPVAFKLL